MNKQKEIKIKEPSVIIPIKKYEELKETLEILSDTELVKSIKKALEEDSGDRLSHEDVFGKG